jgi:hypothetical protein
MDIAEVRRKYPQLLILGGLDKNKVALRREAIDVELETKLPFMLAQVDTFPSVITWSHPMSHGSTLPITVSASESMSLATSRNERVPRTKGPPCHATRSQPSHSGI